MKTTRTGLSAGQRWLLALSCLAVTLVIASMAALYTALPGIAAATGASQRQLTWIVDGYTLTLACLVLPAGALGDRFGRRKMLIAGLIVFSVASAVPLLVDAPVWLIAARAAAGVGAALVMPSTLSLLTAGFPAERRGAAVGLWAGIAGAGAVLGIIGSGLLLSQWSWVSIFVAMTVSGLVLSVAAFTVPESVDQARPALDPLGALTAAFAVGAVVIATIEAPERGWLDPLVLGLFAAGAVAAVAFTLIELRLPQPMLDVRLFADRGFGSGTASITIQFLISFGTFMVLVQFLQLILGYQPLISALAIAPMVVPMVALSMVAPWLADRIGLRWTTLAGLVILGAAMLVMSRLGVDASYLDALGPLLIMSAGLGLCTAPATTAILAGTPPEKHGVAAAVNDAAREIGAAVGIAIMGSLLAAGYSDRIAPALPRLPEAAREPVGDSLAAALQVAERAGPQAQPLADFAKDAFMHGVQQAALVVGCLTLAAAVLVAVWAPGRRKTQLSAPATVEPEPVAETSTR
ncbi:MFS transporter [Nocardia sp. NPDC050435]|uniref:MFS transporter n=1 Tax=Nocardia sp. NPDC050435 TaxID=3155040 RepID=UPI00340623CE